MPNEEVAWSVIEGAVRGIRAHVKAAMEAVGVEMLAELKASVSTQCPNWPVNRKVAHSPAFGYPWKESGEFMEGLYTTVTESGPILSLKLYSQTRRNHGKFLNEGTTRMRPRPWGELIAVKKDWIARIAQAARTMGE